MDRPIRVAVKLWLSGDFVSENNVREREEVEVTLRVCNSPLTPITNVFAL